MRKPPTRFAVELDEFLKRLELAPSRYVDRYAVVHFADQEMPDDELVLGHVAVEYRDRVGILVCNAQNTTHGLLGGIGLLDTTGVFSYFTMHGVVNSCPLIIPVS